MKTLSNIITVSIFLIFGVLVSFTSFPNLLSAAPTTEPPSGAVSPTFSGLTVNGNIVMQNGLVGGIKNNSTLPFVTNCRYEGFRYVCDTEYIDNPLQIDDNLAVLGNTRINGSLNTGAVSSGAISSSGDITSSGNVKGASFGRFYKKVTTSNVSVSASTRSVSAMCDLGDILTGCLGNVSSTESVDRFLGTENNTTSTTTDAGRTCNAWHLNAGPVGDTDSLQAMAICFSPNG